MAMDRKPELSVPKIVDKTDSESANAGNNAEGSIAGYLKTAIAECDAEHSQIGGVATRGGKESSGYSGKRGRQAGDGMD